MAGKRKPHGLLVEEIFRGNRFEDLWWGYDFILLESSKLACHIASCVSQRTPWFTDKGQFITAVALARLSSICVLTPKLKFSKVIWRGPGDTGLLRRNWAQGTGALYTVCMPAHCFGGRHHVCLPRLFAVHISLKAECSTKVFILKTYRNTKEPWKIISQ